MGNTNPLSNIMDWASSQLVSLSNFSSSRMGDPNLYSPGKRWIISNGTRIWYDGVGNVKSDGSFDAVKNPKGSYNDPTNARYYDEKDVAAIYGELDPRARNVYMESLSRAGLISKSMIGNPNAEYDAIADLLVYANRRGISKNDALAELIGSGVAQTTGTASTYRTTNTDDLITAVKAVSKSVIGREISDALAADFAKSYQQQEIQFQKKAYGGGVAMEAPTLETAATTFVKNAAPEQAAGYKYLGYINQLFESIGVR